MDLITDWSKLNFNLIFNPDIYKSDIDVRREYLQTIVSIDHKLNGIFLKDVYISKKYYELSVLKIKGCPHGETSVADCKHDECMRINIELFNLFKDTLSKYVEPTGRIKYSIKFQFLLR